MNIEAFIKDNPFPKNGAEINSKLIALIQDPKKQSEQKDNIDKLFKNNARLIFLVWRQYSYNQSLDAIASFVYEGIEITSKSYKIGSRKPYYSYAMTYIRALLQKHYNYREHLIHIPVKKKKEVRQDFLDVYSSDLENTLLIPTDEDKTMEDDLDALFIEYAAQQLNPTQKEEFEITKMSRDMSIKNISEKTGYKQGKIRNIIKRTSVKLHSFYRKTF